MHWASFKKLRENILSTLAMTVLLGCFAFVNVQAQSSVWERSLRAELEAVHQLLSEENDPRAALDILDQVPRFFPLISDSTSAKELRTQYAELTFLSLEKAQVACDTLSSKLEQVLFRAGLNYQRGDLLNESFWMDQIDLKYGAKGPAHGLAMILLRDFTYCSGGPIDSLKTILSRVWKQKIDEQWNLPFWADPNESPVIVGAFEAGYYDEWINYQVGTWLQSETSNLESIYQILEKREQRLWQSQLRWLSFEDIYPAVRDPLPGLRAALFSADSLEARIQRDQAILKADSLGLLRDLLMEQRVAYSTSIEEIETNYPQFRSFWESTPAPSLQKLQERLNGPNEAFLRYYRLSESIFVLIITNEQVRYVYSEIPADFSALLASLKRSIREQPGPSVTEFLNNGMALYRTLFAPVDSLLGNGIQDLVVALPYLHDFPMEVLLEKEPGLSELLPDWAFLVKRYSFRYTPSCQQWIEEIEKKTAKSTDRFGGFSWDPALDLDGDSTIVWSEMAQGGKIQFTRQQRDVVDLANTFAGDLFLGPEATRANFAQRVHDYQILHLALPWEEQGSDMYWDEGVRFSGSNQADLSARMICGLSLQNDLVLFSGFPKDASAATPAYDQLLPYAFHLSGAKALLQVGWEAPESARINLLERFFAYAKTGTVSAKALQAAKIDFIRQADLPELAHPYYWAAPVLNGDSSSLDLQDENQDLWQISLGLGGLALLILLVHNIGVRLRRRRNR